MDQINLKQLIDAHLAKHGLGAVEYELVKGSKKLKIIADLNINGAVGWKQNAHYDLPGFIIAVRTAHGQSSQSSIQLQPCLTPAI